MGMDLAVSYLCHIIHNRTPRFGRDHRHDRDAQRRCLYGQIPYNVTGVSPSSVADVVPALRMKGVCSSFQR